MYHFFTDDGRVLTPPKELKPLLKSAYPAFFKTLGHIRFFYVADEIWDGKASLVFDTKGERLAFVALEDGAFHIQIGDKDFYVSDETIIDKVFRMLEITATIKQRRPPEQLNVDLDEYPSGIRCDLCQLYKMNNSNDLSGCEKFRVMDRHCYYGVEDGWGESGSEVNSTWICEGKQGCYTKTFACLEKKGFSNCLECGDYRICSNCGVGHNPGECNLGMTAEEVTCLIIPYCEVERLDLLRKNKDDNKIYSRCGQRCDLCLVYRPNVEKDDRREEVCITFRKLFPGYDPDPKVIICDGCQNTDKDGAILLSSDCKASVCVGERKLEHCGYCPDYPCDIFPAEPDADEFYKDMEHRGENWTPEDDKIMEPYNPKRFMDEWRKNRELTTGFSGL